MTATELSQLSAAIGVLNSTRSFANDSDTEISAFRIAHNAGAIRLLIVSGIARPFTSSTANQEGFEVFARACGIRIFPIAAAIIIHRLDAKCVAIGRHGGEHRSCPIAVARICRSLSTENRAHQVAELI